MKVLDTKYYADKLADKFPEVDERSILEIIRFGNMAVYNSLIKTTATVRILGKTEDGKKNNFLLFKQNSVSYNNKAKFKQRKKDKQNGSKK